MYDFSVVEIIVGESANEDAKTLRVVVFKLVGYKLWVCQFLGKIERSSQFYIVVRSLDNLSATLLQETSFQHVLVYHALCQISVLYV